MTYRGEGFNPSWLLLSSRQQDVAPLLSLPLGIDVCPHPLLDELEGALVLGDLEQHHGTPLVLGKATHLSDYVSREFCVLSEAPVAVARPWHVHSLGHLVALAQTHGHSIVQSDGCCSSWLLWRKAFACF